MTWKIPAYRDSTRRISYYSDTGTFRRQQVAYSPDDMQKRFNPDDIAWLEKGEIISRHIDGNFCRIVDVDSVADWFVNRHHKARRAPSVGSVSSGTMRTEDLLHAFADELDAITAPANFDARRLAANARDFADNDPDSGFAADALAALFHGLDDLAPAYCTFGAHGGDGANYGFWPDWESIADLPHYPDLADVPDDISDDFAIVNDHGNVSVYDADGIAILELV